MFSNALMPNKMLPEVHEKDNTTGSMPLCHKCIPPEFSLLYAVLKLFQDDVKKQKQTNNRNTHTFSEDGLGYIFFHLFKHAYSCSIYYVTRCEK